MAWALLARSLPHFSKMVGILFGFVLAAPAKALEYDGEPEDEPTLEDDGVMMGIKCAGAILTLELVDTEFTAAVDPIQTRFPPFASTGVSVPESENPVALWPFTKKLVLYAPGKSGEDAVLQNDRRWGAFFSPQDRGKPAPTWEGRADTYIAGIYEPLIDVVHDHRIFGPAALSCATAPSPERCRRNNEQGENICTYPMTQAVLIHAPERSDANDALLQRMFEPVLHGFSVVIKDRDVWIRAPVKGEVQTLHYRVVAQERTAQTYLLLPEVQAEYRAGGCEASAQTRALPSCDPEWRARQRSPASDKPQ